MTASAVQPADRLRERAQRVRTEQVRSVYLHSPATTAGSLVAGALLVAVMWNKVPAAILLGWSLALCAHQALRIYHYRNYVAATPSEQAAPRWGQLYTIAATIAGCIWGSAGLLMFIPESVPHQAFLSLVLYGIALVSMTSLSAYAPAFYLLVPLTLVPFVLRMVAEPGAIHLYLAAPAVIVLGMALALGRNVNKLIAETLTKRFENLDLIEELSQQKAIAEQARQKAEAASRSKTQFFAAASHDLRQPLHAMGLFAAALHEKIKDPDVLNVVNSINASVSALEGLFNELLDIAKVDSGVIKPSLAHFPLEEVFVHLRDEFTAEAAAKGLRFSVDSGGHIVHSDAVLLERIIRNLLSNAVRYTSQGEIRLSAAATDESVRIAVQDTGPGIPAEDRERIFEEFFQLANPARTSRKGMGLGLSIVKRLADLLGYEIRLESETGRGSTFSFDVVRGIAQVHDVAATSEVPRAQPEISGMLVVVIDDEPSIVEGMKVLLAGWGVDVIGSLTGNDVIEGVHKNGRLPDLIIADYRLGGGRVGTDVIELLRRELDPEIPAVVITGSAAPQRLPEADVQRYQLLLKPVQPEALRALLERTFRRSTP